MGGGITGITTAYTLIQEGFRVAIFEASTLMNGTTGHTTAKITAQHGLIYDQLIQQIGEDGAKLYYEANARAAEYIKTNIDYQRIDCQFQQEDAYIYTNATDQIDKLKREAEAYEKLGIEGGFTNEIPLNIPVKAAVVMKDQAQFHPLHYLTRLIQYIKENGGEIYEQSVATHMEEGDVATVFFRDGHKVRAKYVVSASHFPFHDGQGYFTRLYPKRSYVIAVKVENPYPGGMYISAGQPTRSIRSVTIEDEEMLLVSGQGIKQVKAFQKSSIMKHWKHSPHKLWERRT
ncbi:NAD(P)/FAD-dependent oxidoreductase [Bacillus sp. N9]